MDGWMDGWMDVSHQLLKKFSALGRTTNRFGHPNIRTCCLALGSEALGMI
jgi:hypothetical protein